MADIAWVFHWGPEVMMDFTFEELFDWHRLAVNRLKALGAHRG